MSKKNLLFSLLRSKGARKNVKAADERLHGRKPTRLEAGLAPEAQAAAQVAHDLAVLGRDRYGKAVEPEKIAAAAMFHDVWGGEEPRYNALFAFETDAPEYALYLRAADLIVSYRYCIEQVRMGNGQYEEAEQQLLEAIVELELPEATDYLAQMGSQQQTEKETKEE